MNPQLIDAANGALTGPEIILAFAWCALAAFLAVLWLRLVIVLKDVRELQQHQGWLFFKKDAKP